MTDPHRTEGNNKAYWRKNLQVLSWLLVVWFTCSFGFGVLLVDQLNEFTFLGVPLGFWFAQQGAIYTFIVLIFVYTARMRTIDRQFGVDDSDELDSYDLIPDPYDPNSDDEAPRA